MGEKPVTVLLRSGFDLRDLRGTVSRKSGLSILTDPSVIRGEREKQREPAPGMPVSGAVVAVRRSGTLPLLESPKLGVPSPNKKSSGKSDTPKIAPKVFKWGNLTDGCPYDQNSKFYQQIDQYFEKLSPKPIRHMILKGPVGSGKTTLIRYLAFRYKIQLIDIREIEGDAKTYMEIFRTLLLGNDPGRTVIFLDDVDILADTGFDVKYLLDRSRLPVVMTTSGDSKETRKLFLETPYLKLKMPYLLYRKLTPYIRDLFPESIFNSMNRDLNKLAILHTFRDANIYSDRHENEFFQTISKLLSAKKIEELQMTTASFFDEQILLNGLRLNIPEFVVDLSDLQYMEYDPEVLALILFKRNNPMAPVKPTFSFTNFSSPKLLYPSRNLVPENGFFGRLTLKQRSQSEHQFVKRGGGKFTPGKTSTFS